ncbi:hypothetical protein GGQ73_003735 [Rhizobium skierniewicense]|uniref:Uncharacterized protein n=1 Tax=Rhizobium skierniewicense TaxID=984260 RepID=A0A7W6G3P2_9HYPH|nr:hypothetical protein [Rhizobium skierniewicense]MBB3947764.1 hypothetical protein [Rhizobium skierniewicense]NTF31694.1 hypothetical protein [Rhizobium skierniewicense]
MINMPFRALWLGTGEAIQTPFVEDIEIDQTLSGVAIGEAVKAKTKPVENFDGLASVLIVIESDS